MPRGLFNRYSAFINGELKRNFRLKREIEPFINSMIEKHGLVWRVGYELFLRNNYKIVITDIKGIKLRK